MNIAARLEQLFAATAGERGRPATLREIVDRISERGISKMSVSYLHQLRTGQAENPHLKHLEALADAFGVTPAYFLAEDEADAPELGAEERQLAMRVHGLSPAAIASIRAVVELARKSEQLDEPGGPE